MTVKIVASYVAACCPEDALLLCPALFGVVLLAIFVYYRENHL